MNKQIRSLTWKYFWQQKWDETKGFLIGFLIVLGFIFVPYILGIIFGVEPAICNLDLVEECNPFDYWISGLSYCFVGIIFGMSILFIICIGALFYFWIEENWNLAKRRAIRDCRRKKK